MAGPSNVGDTLPKSVGEKSEIYADANDADRGVMSLRREQGR